MKRTNNVFLLVLALLFGLITMTWQILQTEWFGNLVNQRINQFAKKKVGVEVSFDKVEVGLFPLATKLRNVRFEKNDLVFNASSLGLEFGLRDIISDDFSVGSLSLQDAIIKIKTKNTKKNKIKRSGFFKVYQEKLELIPFKLRAIKLSNSKIFYNKAKIDIVNVKLGLYQNILTFNLNLGFGKNIYKLFDLDKYSEIKIDGFQGEAQVTDSYIRLKKFKAFSENNFIELNGRLNHDNTMRNFKINSFLEIGKLKKILDKKRINHEVLPRGEVFITADINEVDNDLKIKPKEKESINASLEIRGSNVVSSYYKFDSLKANLLVRNQKLILKDFNGKIKEGKVSLVSNTELVDLKEGKYLYPVYNLDFRRIYSNDVLFFLPSLLDAKGFLSGPINLGFRDDKVDITTYEGFTISKFKLLGKEDNIIQNPEIQLVSGSEITAYYSGKVDLDTQVRFPGTDLEIKGVLNNGNVNISILPGKINLMEFGPIVGLDLIGDGLIEGSIIGPYDDVNFNFNLNQENFKILGFDLGSFAGSLNYNTKKFDLSLKNIKGNREGLNYQVEGRIDFKNPKEALDIEIIVGNGTLDSAKVVAKPIFDPLRKYLENIKLNFDGIFELKGELNIPGMVAEGKIKGANLNIFSEDIEKFSVDILLEKNILRAKNFKGKKISGIIKASGSYDLNNDSYKYNGSVSSLRMKDIFYYRVLNLGLDGDAYGEFEGVGNNLGLDSRSQLRIINCSVENFRVQDSVITVYNNKDDFYYSASLVGRDLILEGYLNLDDKLKKDSTMSLKLDSNSLRYLSGIFGKHNIINESIKGNVRGHIDARFNLNNLERLNVVGVLDKLNFQYPGVRLFKGDEKIIFEIKDGKFEKWLAELVGEGLYLKSKGEGSLATGFSLINEFKISSSVTELVTDKILKSQGLLKGRYNLKGTVEKIAQNFSLTGKGLKVRASSLPGMISNLDINLKMINNKLFISETVGEYGQGKIKGTGTIEFTLPFPKVNIGLNVQKSRFPLFKRSGVVVSGDLNLKGEKLPYELKGSLSIIKGDIVEEINDLASSAMNSETYQRFMPIGYVEGNISFLNTNIDLTSFSPVKIKNGLVDAGLGGNLRVFGSISSPLFKGELSIENPENKFLFKGHEFLLSEGRVRFLDGNKKESPELLFSGVTKINDYDIFLNLRGPTDNLNVEMSSNPPLPQEDILSLLTLGVTSDVSRNLGERQRQSVTTLSIGSLIIDQLKINQSLNDSLGLRLSIQPEFIEDENNLLEGRTDDRTGGNRFRSQTVLKLQKKVSKKVNLSLSSTVGGSVDQSQEMNVNYKINKAWSLEGVYEVRSNDELEQELPDSIGADVKYQWSF